MKKYKGPAVKYRGYTIDTTKDKEFIIVKDSRNNILKKITNTNRGSFTGAKVEIDMIIKKEREVRT